VTAPVCGAQVPPAPHLFRAVRIASDKVDLGWTSVSPVTHYSIGYGLRSGDYVFGVDNVGNVTSYVVGGLDPRATYYFVVRGVNDCAPGPWSNELAVAPGVVLGERGGEVLGITTLPETGGDLLWLNFVRSAAGMILGIGFKLLGRLLEIQLGKGKKVRAGFVKKSSFAQKDKLAFLYQQCFCRDQILFSLLGSRSPPD
jgi:hypothetical protein